MCGLSMLFCSRTTFQKSLEEKKKLEEKRDDRIKVTSKKKTFNPLNTYLFHNTMKHNVQKKGKKKNHFFFIALANMSVILELYWHLVVWKRHHASDAFIKLFYLQSTLIYTYHILIWLIFILCLHHFKHFFPYSIQLISV